MEALETSTEAIIEASIEICVQGSRGHRARSGKSKRETLAVG